MEIAGKRVVDATKPVTIKITPRDIAAGDNKNPSSCAAAKAAKHSIDECISARVHIGRVYIEQDKKWVRYNTPDSLKQEIIAFDRGGAFAPGEYTLRPISINETAEGRARKHGEKNRNKPGNLPGKSPRRVHVAKIKRHEVTGIRPKGANR
jgi:hypothetical protein